MRLNLKKWLRLCLLISCLVSTGLLAVRLLDGAHGADAYDEALEIAQREMPEHPSAAEEIVQESRETEPKERTWVPAPVEEDDPHLQTLAETDLDALREVNEDVIGWILIPDTVINYPVLQGEDNQYYLKHTWQGKKNAVGSIFMEYRNVPDYSEFNTILYGHNMNNGSMFASLRRYAAEKYWQKHPYVYLATDAGVYRYEVFSAYRAEVGSTTYGLSFQQEQTRKEFLIHALENSKIDTGVIPQITDRILTLSTCSGSGYSTRWVVHARLKMVQES